ncbi:MAG: ester cyclase [Pseudomonadota bacterium]|nr:ester cyclase [Pseudomonadota bacterium]
MSDQLEANKRFVREFFAAMDAKRFDEMRDMLHPDHKFHLPTVDEPMDKEKHMEMNMRIQQVLTDFDRTFYDQIAEGDRVVSRMRLGLKPVGEINGVPPSGKHIYVEMIHIMRIKDGMNFEEWDAADFIPMLKALKYVPEDTGSPFAH